MAVKVKICCISTKEEAELAVSLGADALGLVSEMPSGPGVIPEDRIAEISESVPKNIDTFLLTSHTDADQIRAQHQRCRTTTIQLVDEVDRNTHQRLKQDLPGVQLVQVIHVVDESAIQHAVDAASAVDALLLDSGNPNLKIKKLGGTGTTHNWNISREIVRAVDTPVYLAGGLTPGNIADALRFVEPSGVDICSGLRTDGRLDRSKVNKFFQEIRRTFQ